MSTPQLPTLVARVRLHEDKKNLETQLLAFAELTIGESFVIKGIRVLKHKDQPEPYLVFPAERGKAENKSRWYDVAHPTTMEARAAATRVILDDYKRLQFNMCKCGKPRHDEAWDTTCQPPRSCR